MNKGIPLKTFLTIYNKARYDCYINYMEGAKLLHRYLTEEGKEPLILPENNIKSVPGLLGSYTIAELAKIILRGEVNREGKHKESIEEYLYHLREIEKAIFSEVLEWIS